MLNRQCLHLIGGEPRDLCVTTSQQASTSQYAGKQSGDGEVTHERRRYCESDEEKPIREVRGSDMQFNREPIKKAIATDCRTPYSCDQ